MGSLTYDYRAKLIRWIDGDSAEIDIDLGFNLHFVRKLRIYGINSPEAHSADPEIRYRGHVARDFARQICPDGTEISLVSVKGGQEKYGRYLAIVILPDQRSFADVMVENGQAELYYGGKRGAKAPEPDSAGGTAGPVE